MPGSLSSTTDYPIICHTSGISIVDLYNSKTTFHNKHNQSRIEAILRVAAESRLRISVSDLNTEYAMIMMLKVVEVDNKSVELIRSSVLQ